MEGRRRNGKCGRESRGIQERELFLIRIHFHSSLSPIVFAVMISHPTMERNGRGREKPKRTRQEVYCLMGERDPPSLMTNLISNGSGIWNRTLLFVYLLLVGGVGWDFQWNFGQRRETKRKVCERERWWWTCCFTVSRRIIWLLSSLFLLFSLFRMEIV